MSMRMTANSRWDNQLEEIRRRVDQRQFWQDVAPTQVAPHGIEKNVGEKGDSADESLTNSHAHNEIPTSTPCAVNSIPRNALASKELREIERQKSEKESDAEGGNSISPSKLVRFSKFNLVGAIGIAVQFSALFLLKNVFNFNYLVATALAVETAVLHNFCWHERFTWVDRLTPAREQRTSGAKARIVSRRVRCAEAPLFHGCAKVRSSGLKRCVTPNPWRSSFARLVRFHLGNGAISILGNLGLMKLLAGQGHMNYLAANAIAITLCSLANFLVSDAWVFAQD